MSGSNRSVSLSDDLASPGDFGNESGPTADEIEASADELFAAGPQELARLMIGSDMTVAKLRESGVPGQICDEIRALLSKAAQDS